MENKFGPGLNTVPPDWEGGSHVSVCDEGKERSGRIRYLQTLQTPENGVTARSHFLSSLDMLGVHRPATLGYISLFCHERCCKDVMARIQKHVFLQMLLYAGQN